MKVLILGSGGREHAIAHSFTKSEKIEKVFVSPGNAGMCSLAELVELSCFEDVEKFVKLNSIDFVFVGPEQPLAEGVVDFLKKADVNVVGPSQKAAQIESSKSFAKNLMKKHNVPTADFEVFSDVKKAIEYVRKAEFPQVIKADGLAAGKGVVIAENLEIAEETLNSIMLDKKFGESGSTIVIEEFMCGWEAYIFAFTDGTNFVSTIFSQDHKPLLDGDKGPNTGGMGAYAPVVKAEVYRDFVNDKIIKPVIDGLKSEGCTYKGILYAGLMITKDGPKVVEFNCRFGDPETEVVLPLLKTDLTDISMAIVDNKIDEIKLEWFDKFAVGVVAASGGYPGKYEKGKLICFDKKFVEDSQNIVYYAGVKKDNDKLYTNGGRVLLVTSIGDDLEDTIKAVYDKINGISFDKMIYRKDIANKGLN